MQCYNVPENKQFIGRLYEREQLTQITQENKAAIIVVYGRRRIGKTELLEQFFRNRHLLKFEGIEGGNTQKQMSVVLNSLAQYTGEFHLSHLQFNSWLPIFELLAKYLEHGEWTLYFEELQWLAEYKEDFISDLKHAWDNQFRKNNRLKLILCGSSPSFMINKVLHSKALYNRSIYEIPIHEFSLKELQTFLPHRSLREIMDAYLSIGGIPEYLNRIRNASSLFLGICQNAFTRGGYFVNECERIFVSSLSNNKHYRKIIEYLSRVKFATRDEIAQHLGIASGGQLTELLRDLIVCEFIESYTPYNQKPKSTIIRYCIRDAYLMFYFKYIEPIQHDILNGDYNGQPTTALELNSYQKWLGFSFERFCRRNHRKIANILGFSAIRYSSGAFFNRHTLKNEPGYQIDLIFQRADHVITICEIKYLQSKAGVELIEPFERQLTLLKIPAKYTIQKVLITTEGATDTLIGRAYFDRVIVLADFFN